MEQRRDRSPDHLARIIEENAAAFLLALGRAGVGEERRDPAVTWTIGGSPIAYHNCVVHAALAPDRVGAEIAASLDLMRARDVPGSWHVGPSMRPAGIGERLVAHGFVYAGPEPGMSTDLAALNEAIPWPPGLTVERVRDEAALAAWAGVLALGFGEGEKEAGWVREMYRRIGLGDDVPWRHYLGKLDGEPVATATLFFAAGAAGVYFVSTAPAYRRRGIGAAITLAALRGARALGFRLAVLGASEPGYGVYRHLGFEERCRIGIYEWAPA